MSRLDEEGRELLFRYEERIDELDDRWATDRFKVGFAIGAAPLHILRDQLRARGDCE